MSKLTEFVNGLKPSAQIGDLMSKGAEIADRFIQTKDEKEKFKQEWEKLKQEGEKQITERWVADSKSDSWLAKNARPLVLIYIVFCSTLLVFIDSGSISFDVKPQWVDLLQLILITVIGAYYGGRSFEKSKKR